MESLVSVSALMARIRAKRETFDQIRGLSKRESAARDINADFPHWVARNTLCGANRGDIWRLDGHLPPPEIDGLVAVSYRIRYVIIRAFNTPSLFGQDSHIFKDFPVFLDEPAVEALFELLDEISFHMFERNFRSISGKKTQRLINVLREKVGACQIAVFRVSTAVIITARPEEMRKYLAPSLGGEVSELQLFEETAAKEPRPSQTKVVIAMQADCSVLNMKFFMAEGSLLRLNVEKEIEDIVVAALRRIFTNLLPSAKIFFDAPSAKVLHGTLLCLKNGLALQRRIAEKVAAISSKEEFTLRAIDKIVLPDLQKAIDEGAFTIEVSDSGEKVLIVESDEKKSRGMRISVVADLGREVRVSAPNCLDVQFAPTLERPCHEEPVIQRPIFVVGE